MENELKIAALVPMRHHSQRVPGKNYRPLNGRPLYQHILDTLLACPEIATVVVDTDSPVIMEGLQSQYAAALAAKKLHALIRPDALCADDVAMNEILAYDTGQVEADFYLQTHATNPLLKAETVRRGLQRFISIYPAYDSLFSVTRLRDQLGRAINHNPAVLLQTQDLPPVFEENSCLYLFSRETLLRRRNRLGDRPMMFEISAEEAWDIDNELDFAVTEFLMRRSGNEKNNIPDA